ncbi:MAG: glycosyltransferase family 4 protein [Candidatus Omnitrophica bacterium]|nr:glycosyltransferase family 4 protein [Candidatus Omnitrophota bacterium]
MKKILLISFEYPTGKSYSGGVGQIVKQCRSVLLDLGYEVYVLITSEFHKKHPVKMLLPNNSLIGYPNFWRLQKEYDLSKFSFIIQHFVNWTKELKKLKERKGKRPGIIYHFHSILRREKDSGFKTFNRFMVNQEKMIQIADKIICPSIYEYDNFSRYFPSFVNKVKLVENTIETFPADEDEIQRIKKHHGLRENDILSIYVGRLERIKGAHILLEEIPNVLKKHKNHKIFIIGKALERNLYKKLVYLKKKYPKQVFYMRYIEKRKLYQYYYMCHLYINTSLSESFSLSAHESAFCGNALLLNELPVFDKFKDAALFFSNRDSIGNEFIKGYRELVKNEDLRARLSRRACRIVREFSTHNRLKEDLSGLFGGA